MLNGLVATDGADGQRGDEILGNVAPLIVCHEPKPLGPTRHGKEPEQGSTISGPTSYLVAYWQLSGAVEVGAKHVIFRVELLEGMAECPYPLLARDSNLGPRWSDAIGCEYRGTKHGCYDEKRVVI